MVRTLDDYWKQILKQEQVFLMKMDVQGFEGFAIKGGTEMFKTKPPIFLFMEFSPQRYRAYKVDGAQILKDLIGFGYNIKTIFGEPVTLTNGKIEELAATASDLEFDLELTHSSFVIEEPVDVWLYLYVSLVFIVIIFLTQRYLIPYCSK